MCLAAQKVFLKQSKDKVMALKVSLRLHVYTFDD